MFIVFVPLVLVFYFLLTAGHERKIYDKIESLGGTVVSIERRKFRRGPFVFAGKGTVVYWIEYRVNGELREGWVKFGSLFGPDWRL